MGSRLRRDDRARSSTTSCAPTRRPRANEREPLLVHRAAAGLPRRARPAAAASSRRRPIGDGHSNVTYLIERGGWECVLRRPPRGPLPPSAPRRAARGAGPARLEPTARARRRACSRSATTSGHRRAVLRHGEGRGLRRHDRDAARARHARGAPAHRRASSSTRSSRSTPSTGAPPASRASASRPATSSASCAASSACGSTTARASSPAVERVGAWLAEQPPESPPGDDRPRRLPPRQRDDRRRTRRRGSSRSSTGRWRRSATRSPTSATSRMIWIEAGRPADA